MKYEKGKWYPKLSDECPLPRGTKTKVMLEDGIIPDCRLCEDWYWDTGLYGDVIVAFCPMEDIVETVRMTGWLDDDGYADFATCTTFVDTHAITIQVKDGKIVEDYLKVEEL